MGVWGDVTPGALGGSLVRHFLGAPGGSLGRRSPRCTGWESGETFPQVHWVGVWGDVPPGALGGSLGRRSPRCTRWESGETFPRCTGWESGETFPRCTRWEESGETFPQVHWVGVWGDVPPGALGGSLGRRSPRCTRWESGETFPRCPGWESGETFPQKISHNTVYRILSGASIPKPVGPPDKKSVQLTAGEGAAISCKVPMQMNTKLGICFAPVGENLTSLNRSKSCVECDPFFEGVCKGSIATKPGWQVARSSSNTATCMPYQITNLTVPKVQEGDRGTVYCYWSTSSEVGSVYQMEKITVFSDSWIDQNWEYLVVGGVGVTLVLVVLLGVVSIARCYIRARRRRIRRLMHVADYPTEIGRGGTKRHAVSNHNTGWHDLSIHLSITVICLT